MITDIQAAKQLFANNNKSAYIVGNGINRYAFQSKIDTSWGTLLLNAWKNASFITKTEIGKGITFTEFYDILEMESEPGEIRESIVSDIRKWPSTEYHQRLIQFFKNIDKPILTTNFDFCLGNENLNKIILEHPTLKKGFTDYYPWNVVYTDKKPYTVNNIYDFGLWYINGNIEYERSIKLSLSEYTRQSKRAVEYLHSSHSYDDNFVMKNREQWKGMNTWLHLIFNCDLFIMGLGLDEQETFLRWLLIERMKYFRKFKNRKKNGWYICRECELTDGKQFFLERVGFEIIALESYDEIYEGLIG